MRLSLLFLLALAFSTLTGCDWTQEPPCERKYAYCHPTVPEWAALHVRVTIDGQALVPIALYQGHIEDSVLYLRDTLTEEKKLIMVPPTGLYSAVAYYQQGNQQILAIDGATVEVTSDEDCGDICYFVNEGRLNLKL